MSAFSGGISSILRSISEQSKPVHVSGGSIASSALTILSYLQEICAQSSKKNLARIPPTVLLVPNDEIAGEIVADLECLASAMGFLASHPPVFLHFPTWEQSPYSAISLSLRTRFIRLGTLSALKNNSENPILVVTTLAAFSQMTLSPQLFSQATLSLAVDQVLPSREALISRLNESGFERVDTVEDLGTFAVRGDIIDVFAPHSKKPLRVELFGDQVEKIREFDPATQRTLSDSKVPILKIVLPPAREVLFSPQTIPVLRENLKTFADDRGIPRSTRDPILASIQFSNAPVYHDHSESWAAFAYSDAATLYEHLCHENQSENQNQWQALFYDEMGCYDEWTRFRTEQEKYLSTRPLSAPIVPPVEVLYSWNPELAAKVHAHVQLFLDRISLTSAAEVKEEQTLKSRLPSHLLRVEILDNKKFVQGSRHSLKELESDLLLWIQQGYKILALASTQSQLERIRYLLEERKFIALPPLSPLTPSKISLAIGSVSEGFVWPAEGLVLLTEGEILGAQHKRQVKRTSSVNSGSSAKNWSGLQALSDLLIGDAVVHREHGIGRYQGLARLSLSGAPSDFLVLEYANRDKLYLPVYRLNVIQKYVGSGETANLDRLGSQQFQKTKDKVRNDVKSLAVDLVQLYAQRKIHPGIQFSPRDNLFREFEAQFPFDETPDQLAAIDTVLADMESGRVMDRLVCGDVGYGKTEVAMRAAFKAVSDGKQVAVLVPTTILAQQHEISFRARLGSYPVLIESLSRFKSKADQTTVLEALKAGKIDIIIGTHRLLSKDVQFSDLGLVIVDEEHRFGVGHKERLKTLKINTHVLTLTATPIPRTLHMALSGLRDISLINTAPIDRLPVRTYVSKYDDEIVKKAIEHELARGGQVFVLNNRVQNIFETARRVNELVPTAQVVVAHGQMPEKELEKAMASFYERKANVLVCTTIIESGLDLPLANTILILRADTLGLAQLYQIRGRVGRGQNRAFAYLFVPEEGALTPDARRRLEVIQKFVELGSGFSIASHDLEIRGGGDLLGPQQSGSIAAVGFDLYTEILEEAIREIQGKPISPEDSQQEPEIKAPFPAYLSEDFVPDVHQRLSLYRRFSAAGQDTDIDRLEEEVRDRFGPPPLEAQNLFWLLRIKIVLKRAGIEAITVGPEKVSLSPGPRSQLNPVRAIALVSAYPHRYQLMPDSKIVARIPTGNLRDLLFALEGLLKDFA